MKLYCEEEMKINHKQYWLANYFQNVVFNLQIVYILQCLGNTIQLILMRTIIYL
jgi:hypothetical protein